MKILIVAATEGEVGILKQQLPDLNNAYLDARLLVTGVGSIATTYALTRELDRNKYDFVLQVGVGGSFDHVIQLGEVVFITSDCYGDLGAEDHDKYLDIFEMGLIGADTHPHISGKLVTPQHPLHNHILLQQVAGLTINTVSGCESTIAARRERHKVQVESMEGAAFHYVCLQDHIPFAQVRGISNYVIPRDKSQWQMKDAIINLNNWVIGFLKEVQ